LNFIYEFIGTPEILIKGTQDATMDWWAIGCVLFFCITGGRYLFEYKGGVEKQKAHISDVLLEIGNKNQCNHE